MKEGQTINPVYKVCKAKNNLFNFMRQILTQIKNILSFATVWTSQWLEIKLGLEDIGQNLSKKGNTAETVLGATVQAYECVRTLCLSSS